jgi:hypothetical protein
MSSDADPGAIVAALNEAAEAFDERGHVTPVFETAIDKDAEWTTQLTKGCQLLTVVGRLDGEGFYTAMIELCFGAIERSFEAYALNMGGDTLSDFQNHEYSYKRAGELGLVSRDMADELMDLYRDNRTESYYGGLRPTAAQAAAMTELATEVHDYVCDQIREGGVCRC